MRRSLTGAVITAALLIPASAAQASQVFLDDSDPYRTPPRSTVYYFADEDETNNVTVTNGADGALVINDPGANINDSDFRRAAGECTVSADKHTATCQPNETTTPLLRVDLDNLNDTFTDSASIPSENDVRQCFFEECTGDTPTQVFDVITTVDVNGGEGDDTLNGNDNAEDFFAGFGTDTVRAGGGDDEIDDVDQSSESPEDREANSGDDHFFGGPGSDYLSGGDGNDELRGEDGDDFIEGRLGSDTIDGGNGFDGAGYFGLFRYNPDGTRITIKPTDPGATITLNATAATTGNGADGENDSLVGIEDVDGTEASDTIAGSALSNVIFGNSGNDTITGAAGNDNLNGNSGDDTINGQDSEVDSVDCGGGIDADKANVDNIDNVRNCGAATVSTVVVPPVPPVVVRDPTDTVKAKFTQFKAAKKQKAKTARRKGKFSATFTSDSDVVASAELEGKAGKKALRSTVGYVSLAKKSKTVKANVKTKLTVTVKKKLRKQFKKRKKLRLIITLTDAGNNKTTKKVTIKLT